MGLELRVLGPIEVQVDGEARPLGGLKPRALLAALLLRRGEVVAADALIEDVWSGKRGAAAARSVQVYVSELRKALGGRERIRSEAGGYRLQIEPDELDADRFESLVADGRRLLAAGDADAASERLRAALALWRGTPFADVAYEPFAQREVARLEDARLGALEERLEAELVLGRHAELLPELRDLVAEHPLRERLRRQLMLALYRTGRQADALSEYREARRVLVEELGIEPGDELRRLEGAILRQEPSLAVEPAELRARRLLPAPATPLVGRRREVEDVKRLLGEARLVTLTGPGGTGKTRLSIQAAHELAEAFPGGVVFVSLASLQDPAFVPSEIASALGIEDPESLPEEIRARRLLLVLDNFEQVDDAAPGLGELLAAAPLLRLLVTSRRPLRISAEHVYVVPPLALEEEAIPLLQARVQAAAGRSISTDAGRELCAALDCLPLAIELVAGRARHLNERELLAALPAPLALASAGARDLPGRQQTLAATIGWSFELLDEEERAAFARLSVFSGGWTAEAAGEVCDTSRETLALLTEKSLITWDGERFAMLETVREYALERLAERDEGEATTRRHAEYVLRLALASKESRRTGAEVEWHDRLDAERNNVRTALDWWLDRDVTAAARLADGAFRFWYMRGHFADGIRAYERVNARSDALPAGERGRQLGYGAAFSFARQDLARALALAQGSLALHRESGDAEQEARVLVLLGTILSEQGDDAGALVALEEAATRARGLADDAVLAFALSHLSRARLYAGNYEQTVVVAEEALELMRRTNDLDGERGSLTNLVFAALLADDPAEAVPRVARILEISRQLRHPVGIVEGLEAIAAVAAFRGDAQPAARLLGAAEALADAADVRLEAISRRLRARTTERVTGALGEERFAALHAAGRALDLVDAADEAASTLRSGSAAAATKSSRA